MSSNANQLSSCTGKQPHSQTTAETIARQMRRNKDYAVQAYRCRYCGAWHVGEVSSFWGGGAPNNPPKSTPVRQTPQSRRPVPASLPRIQSIDQILAERDMLHVLAARDLCAGAIAYLQSYHGTEVELRGKPYLLRLRRIKAWLRAHGQMPRMPDPPGDQQKAAWANGVIDLLAPYV